MKCAGNLLSNHCFKLSPIQQIVRFFWAIKRLFGSDYSKSTKVGPEVARVIQKHQSWPRGHPCHTKAPKLAKRSPVSYKSTKVGPEVTSVIQKHQSWPRGRQCHMIYNFVKELYLPMSLRVLNRLPLHPFTHILHSPQSVNGQVWSHGR